MTGGDVERAGTPGDGGQHDGDAGRLVTWGVARPSAEWRPGWDPRAVGFACVPLLLLFQYFMLEVALEPLGTVAEVFASALISSAAVLALWATGSSGRAVWGHASLGLFAVALAAMTGLWDQAAVRVSGIVTIYLAFVISWSVLRYVLRKTGIDGWTVTGAFAVYVAIGVAFGELYTTIAVTSAGHFSPLSAGGSLYYFSFVVLTTLGFGDITATQDWVRFFVTIEAMLGQVFLAVLVARLVGIQTAQRSAAIGASEGESQGGPGRGRPR